MNKDINSMIKEIHVEDFIWVINFFIILFALMSNDYQENFIKTKSKKSYDIFHTINLEIFIVVFLINVYFLNLRYKSLKSLRTNASKQQILNANLNYLAAIIIVIGTFIYFYTEFFGANIEEEIPF